MIQRRVRGLILAILSCSALGAPRPAAPSAWMANGIPLAPTDSAQTMPVIASDGQGGAYIAWQEYRSGWGVYATRLMSDGTIATGWPGTGRLVGAGYVDPVMVADGDRGVYIAAPTYTGSGVTCWYVSLGGAISTSAAMGGTALSSNAIPARIAKTDPSGLPSLLSAGPSRAYLVWSQGYHLNSAVLLQRLAPAGLDPAWPGNVVIVPWATATAMCPDENGGVLVALGSGMGITRVNGFGAPVWNSPALAAASSDAPGLVSDGAGGALAFWLDRRSGVAQVYAQHVVSDGTIDLSWPVGGLRISSQASEAGIFHFYDFYYPTRYSSVAPDGAGGAYVAWSETRVDSSDIYVQHVLATGALAPGWPQDGLAVCTAAGTQWLPSLAADGAGGVLVSWQDHRSGEWDVYAQRISGAGVAAWPANGIPVCASGGDQTRPAIASDMAGGAFLAWEDARCGTSQMFGSRVPGDGALPSSPGVGSVALVSQSTQADSGSIRLSWRIAHGTLNELPPVYCRHVDTGWRQVGTAWPDLQGNLVYSDTGALEGCQYGYALGVTNCGIAQIMGEVWVQTPMGHGFTTLAVSSRQAVADSGAVRLHWDLAGGEALAATISRRDSCSDWVSLGTFPTDGSGALDYHDTSPQFAGSTVEYRLVVQACGSSHDLGSFPVALPEGAGFLPTSVSLTFSRVDTTSAAFTWLETSGPASVGTVYRRDSLEAWSTRGVVTADATRHFHFNETGLLPHHAYEYRIGLTSCGVETYSAPVTIQTEANPARGLWLRAAYPNPASHDLTVDLSLLDGGAVTLELIDAGGRRLIQRSLDALGPGLHAYSVGDLSGVPSGFYLLRLSQGGHAQTRRIAIVH